MALTTALTEKFGIAHPILLAPMGFVSGGRLAAAVTQAGGLGFIGGGYGERAWLEREIAAAGNAAYGVGFITWKLADNPDLLALSLDRGPSAVFLSFGDLSPYVPAVKAAGVPLIAQVQTVAQAKSALDAGADILVAQGAEAGGHGGARATFPLVPAVADVSGDVPVVAAGGISDGRGVAAALMLGAAGVLCGTAFYVAEESLATPGAKARAVSASGDETEKSDVFDRLRGFTWPGGWSLRTLTNITSRRYRDDPDAFEQRFEDERARFEAGRDADDADVMAVLIGEGIGQVRAVEPAAAILTRLVAEAEDQLRGAPKYIAGA